MTELLEKALAEIGKLPEQDQDVIASWILQELAAERRWAAAFAQSADLLAELAAEALRERAEGKSPRPPSLG